MVNCGASQECIGLLSEWQMFNIEVGVDPTLMLCIVLFFALRMSNPWTLGADYLGRYYFEYDIPLCYEFE